MSKNKYDITLNVSERNNSHMGLAARVRPQQRVLELGCSSGYLSRYLKEELACQIVGVEIDSDALQQAAPFCEQVIVANLDSNAWLADIEGQQFDVVLCADVLEHLKDPVAMLASLKPFFHADSYLLVSVPNIAHASIRLELLQGHFDYESLGILDDTHLHFYTRDSLIAMLMQAGYECRDISYTSYDMADEAIDQHLANAGLEPTKEARALLHAPDAIAYQFIIEARPAPAGLLQRPPLPISPKPLVSSGTYYREKQEKIDSLEQQLVRERMRHQQHIGQLAATQLKKEPLQNVTNYWHKTTAELDGALFTLAEQLQKERERNDVLSSRIEQLEERLSCLTSDTQRLEQVLQRVHAKISYRLMRGAKNISKSITRFLRKTEQTEQQPILDVFDYNAWIAAYENVTKQALVTIKEETESWQKAPRIAVLMPLNKPDKSSLINAIESVLQQTYSNFELCIADEGVTVDYVQEIIHSYQENDPRVKAVLGETNAQASAANRSLSLN